MRRMTLAAAVVAVLLNLSIPSIQAGDHHEAAKPVTNKVCPLMNDAVDPNWRVEYEGQYVYFCCKGCIDMFNADPKAAVARMSDEEKAAIQKNTTCPVTGEAITSWDTRVEADGKQVYFCCGGCKSKYGKKPAN